jgi:hypothetical protein
MYEMQSSSSCRRGSVRTRTGGTTSGGRATVAATSFLRGRDDVLQFWRGMREGGAGKAKERANDGRDVARGRGGLCGCQIVRRGVLWKGRIMLIFWELFWRKMERSVAAVRVVGRNVSEPVLDDQGAPFDRGEGVEGELLPGEHRREERGG